MEKREEWRLLIAAGLVLVVLGLFNINGAGPMVLTMGALALVAGVVWRVLMPSRRE